MLDLKSNKILEIKYKMGKSSLDSCSIASDIWISWDMSISG